MSPPTSNSNTPTAAEGPQYEFVIIGAGIAGLGMAQALKSHGYEDFVVMERASDIGGVWLENRYPGVAVDIPSHAYQFHFYLKPDWSRLYPRGEEVKSYLDDFVEHFGLRPHIHLNSPVRRRTWNEDHHCWELLVAGRVVTCRWVISAVGNFLMPRTPDLPGLDDFEGTLLRSQRWDDSCDLSGKRVAVIGTGASAVQLVPQLSRLAAHLEVYQRTPIWVVPKIDPAMPGLVQRIFRRFPATQRVLGEQLRAVMERLLIGGVIHYDRDTTRRIVGLLTWLLRETFYRRCVADPLLRRRLTPTYGFGCKRPSLSSTYLRTFTEPHVDLVCTAIERITATGVRTIDGTERRVDAIVLATGFFMAHEPEPYRLEPVYGRGGFDLAECFATQRSRSYEGVSIPGLPNHLFVYGPYGGTGGTYHDVVHVASLHILRVIDEARRRNATSVEVSEAAADGWTATMRDRAKRTLFNNNDCGAANSYYFDRNGDLTFLRLEGVADAMAAQRNFSLDDYNYVCQVPTSAAAR